MPASLSDKRATFRYFIRSMLIENKQRKTMFLLLEMWAMANRSDAVSKMMDTFYGRLRASIERNDRRSQSDDWQPRRARCEPHSSPRRSKA